MTEAAVAAAGEIIIRYTCKLESGQIDAAQRGIGRRRTERRAPRDRKHLGRRARIRLGGIRQRLR